MFADELLLSESPRSSTFPPPLPECHPPPILRCRCLSRADWWTATVFIRLAGRPLDDHSSTYVSVDGTALVSAPVPSCLTLLAISGPTALVSRSFCAIAMHRSASCLIITILFTVDNVYVL